MGRRIVDVFIRDRLLASYPVVLELNEPITDEEYVEAIRQRLRDSKTPDLEHAKFVIRVS